jgi:DNA-directed RNA polymerase subunit RPC12/RpoP
MPQIETLGRLMNSDTDRLQLACKQCGHVVEQSRREAWAVWGMQATPHTIRRRAKCAKCGERNLVSITLV